ncbi:unnamed protein product [Rhodiola kirilowii]
MAHPTITHLFFHTLLLLLCVPPLIPARTFNPNSNPTITLDVSASIQQTRNVFSLNPLSVELLNQEHSLRTSSSSSSSSPLTLQLHSRSSIFKPSDADYSSLVMSRLQRDSERVRSLTARLNLAVNKITKSDLEPEQKGEIFEPEAVIQGPIVSGTSFGSGEYFSRVGIGSPPKQVYMVLDTGSDVTWVQCAPCADCYQQTDPIFEPASSSSFKPLTCETSQCRSLDVTECRNNTCLYEVSYGDGSYTVGDFVTETVTFSNSNSVSNVAIGCGHSNAGLFVAAAGLLGLGGGELSFPSQANATSFSYCLVDRDSDSASTLEFNSALPQNAVVAPLLRSNQIDTFLYVGMSGLSVGGEMLPLPESLFAVDKSTGDGGVIVDSGTAITRLQTEVYTSLRDAFAAGTKSLPKAEAVALFDTCYDFSEKTSVEVPTVTLHFPEGKALPLPAKNYLIPVDSNGTFCFAFAPTATALSILGNVQQQGTRVGFDFVNSVIGFSPNQC